MVEYPSSHYGTQQLIDEQLADIVEDSVSGTLGYTASFANYGYIVEPTITVTNNTDLVDINVNGVTIGQLQSGGDVATVGHLVADGSLTLSSASNFDVEIVTQVRQ